ncbi:putative lysosomal cobalamin transporter [Dothidotthia symphoricarpi CBS 119687]|uniref:Probable lysosomal cobalamin transporter n=1 Tax=Dothidotthia symphoricarpi CBS 119687 TaxID=1392245 RepID=A0A6A6APW9_9PLEO|nr:putative lysosomal cobalamin transporter [Dothidotthia symphoricarpi CBS 119687]KAF2132561.1 putative lysosomal cobalamin transporter [Dothidotthia symphoricarpi CBS 119687]
MALIQTSLIWVAYAVAIAVLFVIAAVFVYMYQTPRDRSASVTIVCIFTTLSLLATVLLIPVDVALVSSTSRSSLGCKKDWATPAKVDAIVHSLTAIYYALYTLDAVLCLLVVPFTYFWHEEYDEDAAEHGEQSAGQRFGGALKWTLAFLFFVIAIFLTGFFVPFAKQAKDDKRLDLDFFKHLLAENHGERALSFCLGLLITIGTVLFVLYTGAGMALLPVAMIKSAPSISAPTLAANTASQLEHNRERQRQLEGRSEGREGGLDARDRRELEALNREERTLIRRERLVAESSGEDRHWVVKTWIKIEAIFRPLKLIGGLLLMVFALVIFASMLITAIDKAKNSICGAHCGYILGHINIFQPLNWVLVRSSKVFPIDYILFLLLVIFLFSASVVGIATAGIRFLWITIWKIRKGKSSPQALLMATVLLTLIVLAINYSVAMVVAPQYATWGPQTYCDLPVNELGAVPDCSEHKDAVRSCTELAKNPAAKDVCTPSVLSTFINRITINFPFFGVVLFWAQFAFLGVYIVVFVTTLFKTPKLDQEQLDRDLEEEEEEGLLASTGRRFNATWQDITGRSKRTYGTTDARNGERSGESHY